MKKLITMAIGTALLFSAATAGAATINCDVTDDGYLLRSDTSNGWYMTQSYGKSIKDSDTGAQAMGLVNAYGFMKFDLSGLEGLVSDDVASASLSLYIYGEGKMGGTPTGPNKANTLEFNAYASGIAAANYDFDLNESQGGYAQPDIIEGTTTSAYVEGENFWINVDLTNIVKMWLDGAYNNGVRITETRDDDQEGVFWSAHDDGFDGATGLPVAADHVPFLTVTTGAAPVPVPAAFWLFASGLAGLFGFRRKNRQAKSVS